MMGSASVSRAEWGKIRKKDLCEGLTRKWWRPHEKEMALHGKNWKLLFILICLCHLKTVILGSLSLSLWCSHTSKFQRYSVTELVNMAQVKHRSTSVQLLLFFGSWRNWIFPQSKLGLTNSTEVLTQWQNWIYNQGVTVCNEPFRTQRARGQATSKVNEMLLFSVCWLTWVMMIGCQSQTSTVNGGFLNIPLLFRDATVAWRKSCWSTGKQWHF